MTNPIQVTIVIIAVLGLCNAILLTIGLQRNGRINAVLVALNVAEANTESSAVVLKSEHALPRGDLMRLHDAGILGVLPDGRVYRPQGSALRISKLQRKRVAWTVPFLLAVPLAMMWWL